MGPIHALTFSPDSKLLAVAFSDGTIHIWAIPEAEADARLHTSLFDPDAMDSTLAVKQYTLEGEPAL